MAGALSERLSSVRLDPDAEQPARFREPQAAEQNRTGPRNDLAKIKARIQRELIAELGTEADLNTSQGRRQVELLLNELVEAQGLSLPRVERARLLEAIVAEVLSFGPIEPLLRDSSISEVMVNGPHQIWVERSGRLSRTDIQFEDDEHVRRIIDRIIAPLGRRCDEASPMVDARLPDGSRVNAIIPPLSLVGPVITIRKFSRDLLTMNVLSTYIPSSERIITIEDAAELQLRQEHVITLEKRPASVEGRGEVTIRDLVVNARYVDQRRWTCCRQ
jgi:pilus assembly protein CpaF